MKTMFVLSSAVVIFSLTTSLTQTPWESWHDDVTTDGLTHSENTGGIKDADAGPHGALELMSEDDLQSHGVASLTFVFDTTGSMYDDLVQVIEGAAKILATTLAMRERHLHNYILVPFHDPEVGPVTATTDPEKFQQELRDLYVQGGGDCPEMSITGIKMALQESLPNSFIYVFTDARAKDYDLTDEVLSLIQHKQSQVIFVMTGDCGNVSHPGFRAYEKIASTSSGQVFLLQKSQVNKILDFVRVAVQGRKVNLLAVDLNQTSPDTSGFFSYDLAVDSKLLEFTISVSGQNATISVKDPYGNILTPETGLSTLLSLDNALVVNVKNPRPGLWGVKIGFAGESTVRVTGLSPLDFVHGFSRNSTLQLADTFARPVKGIPTFVFVNATDLQSPGRLTKLELVDLHGELLMEIPVVYDPDRPSPYNVSSFLPPSDFFYLKIVGLDDKGHLFQRATPTAISGTEPERPKIEFPSLTRGYFNRTVLLTCQVSSLVPFELNWYYGNETLGDSLFYSESTNVTWSIPDVSSFNEGHYSCHAVNVAGSTSALTYLDVTDPPPHVFLPGNVSVTLEKDAMLICLGHSTVEFNITWLRHPEDPQSFDLENRLLVFPNGTAVIRKVRKSDEGRYLCRASNEGGETDEVAWLQVQTAPSVTVERASQVFISGQTVTLQCMAVGRPQASFGWQRKGLAVQQTERISYDERSGRLTISETLEEDEGEWECVANNSLGYGNASATLRRIASPIIFVFNRTVLVANGDTAILNCTADGIPPPNITWMKNGIQLQEISFLEILPQGVLKVIGAQENDVGEYECVASNEAGTVKEAVHLEVGFPAVLVHRPQSRGIDVLKNVTVQCAAAGKPTPRITWKGPDGMDIPSHNHRVRVLENGDLFIHGIEKEDEGTYTCTAENELGKQQVTAFLTVTGIVKPVIASSGSGVEAVVGKDVKLSCVILRGNPTPQVTWSKLGEPVTPSDGVIVDDLNGNLVLQKVKANDEGDYTCVASNVGGTSYQVVKLSVHVPPSINDSGTEYSVIEGHSVRLLCEAHGNPKPQVTWSKNGAKISDFDPHYLVDETGSLEIFSVDAKDGAIYTCTAVNIAGIKEKRSSLFVQIPPKMERDLDEVRVVINSPAQLPCEATGQPPPTISWRKTGQVFDSVGADGIELLSNGAIRISSTRTEDAGLYECVASNAAGNASKFVTLVVQVPPQLLDRTTSTLTVTAGRQVILPCEVTGEPRPLVTWKKNLNAVNFSLEHRYHMNESGSLVIPDVNINDTARFMCVAENPAGIEMLEIQLIVQEPPFFPFGLPENTTVVVNDRITLSCPAQGTPFPKVTWIKDGKPLSGNELNARISPDGSLSLDPVHASDAGSYRCNAENAAGNISNIVALHVYSPPRFETRETETELEVAQVVQGQPVRIQCKVNSFPAPFITWYKDGTELMESDFGERLFLHRGNTELEILEADVEDAGRYTCIARNVAGEAEKITELEVLVAPVIDETSVSDVNLSVIVTRPLVINCPVTGTPQPEISWFKDGDLITGSYDRDIRILAGGQRLEFGGVDLPDVGRYTCEAKNPAGTIDRHYNLSILVPPKINGSDSVTTTEVLLNSSISLRCAISGFPHPQITWYHDGRVIDNNTSGIYLMAEGLGLHIPQVELTHGGEYTCRAVNEAGESSKDELLNVLVVPQINETGPAANRTIIINETMTISCFSTGSPVPEVIWLKNGEVIDLSRHPNIQLRSRGHQLVIRNAGTTDSAIYRCLVTNKAGQDSLDFVLNVQVPASIDRLGHDLNPTVRLNHTRTLHCPVYGVPKPEIVWYKNGDLLSLKTNQYIYSHDEGRRLEITVTSVDDSGTYECRVHNDAGEDELIYHLKVIVPPEIDPIHSTSSNPKAIVNDTVSIACLANGIPAPDISWFINGQPLDRTNQRYSLSRDGRRLQVYSIEVADSGRYTCVAKNEAGVAERDFDLEVLVPPYMDSADLHKDVKVIKGKIVTLECPVQGIPFPNVTWMKNDEPLELDSRMRLLFTGRHLELSMAAEADAAEYTCTGSNEAGEARMTFNVSVYVAPTIDEANLVDSPRILINRTMLLECLVGGIPPPQVTWLKNGEPFLPRPGIRFLSGGRLVEMSRTQVTDTARYTCVATNEAGELRKSYDLQVLVPPTIDGAGKTEMIEVVEGRTVYISCTTSGIPEPSIVWIKDGKPLTGGMHTNKRELSNGRQLEVHHVTQLDEGLYRCQATNVAGQKNKNYRVKVLIPPKISGSRSESELSVNERHPFLIDCNFTGSPEPKVTWYKDGAVVNVTDQLQILRGGRVLQVSVVSAADAGLYTCTASNAAGQDEKIYRLQVFVPPELNNSQTLEELSVVVGSSVSLDCSISRGFPKPIVRWTREGHSLSLVAEPNIRVQDGGQRLHIFNVQLSDEGRYTCTATSEAGSSSKDFLLHVLVPPTIEEGPTEVVATVGSRTSLMCEAVGLPRPEVFWEKDGVEIPNSGSRYSMLRSGTLQFSAADVEDSGTYRCIAMNEAGTTIRDFTLSVQVPPAIDESGPSIKKVIVGDPVLLPCNSSGFPPPRVTWQKGTRLLSGVPGYIILANGSLLIESAEHRYGGVYVCIVQNNAGTALSQKRLEIQVPPIIEQDETQYTVVEEREVILLCRVSGVPQPTVRWVKTNRTIATDDDIHYRVLRNHGLAIPFVREEDSGVFTCVAENEAGNTSVDITLEVHVPPVIKDQQRMVTLKEGETAELHCVATGYPEPEIMWIQDGRTMLVTGGRYKIHNSGTLTIKNVQNSDSGNYVCTAKNIAARDTKEFSLKVQVPPKITLLPREQEVNVNGRIDLECAAEGVPTPTIIWKVNNTELPTSPLSINGRSRLVIGNAMKHDDGTYMCIAENPAGTSRALAAVLVKVPPKVVMHSESQSVSRSERVLLNCPVDGGDPPPTIVWTKHNQVVSLNERVHQLSNGSLVIHDASPEDTGDYKCIATNDAGSSDGVAHVTVEMPPEFLIRPQSQTVEQGQTVWMDCTASGEPAPSMSWMKEGLTLETEDRFSILPNNTLRIVAVQLSDSGSYICIARNSEGILVPAELTVQVNGHWSPWSAWLPCTVTCGQGTRHRKRRCDNPEPLNGGRPCVGPPDEIKICTPGDCPVDGGWNEWSPWEECSRSCGQGQMSRSRECNSPMPAYGGKYCSGDSLQNDRCNVQPCPVDGGWGGWTAWRFCSETCGSGIQERFRYCDSPRPEHGGHECLGNDSERQHCHLADCEVHGGWSGWNEWSICSLSCGRGQRIRQRKCDSPSPSNGGRRCLGQDVQTELCNQEDCPVHSEWMGWSEWGACTVSCGGGQRRRFRTCFDPTSNSIGRPCIGPPQETEDCNSANCAVDGEWNAWSQWTECNQSCDGGTQERQRTCKEPKFGGNTCQGDSQENRKCNTYPCQAGFPQKSISNVVGKINSVDLGVSRFVASINRTNEGSIVSATLMNASSVITARLQHLVSLLHPTYWTIASEMDEAVNGYSLTKGNFRTEVNVEFATGQMLKMVHYARGLDNDGILQVDTFANGEVPALPEGAKVVLMPFDEDYIQTGPGSIYGQSSRLFLVNGHVLPYAWNHSTSYNPEFGRMPYLIQRMVVRDLHFSLNISQKVLGYRVTTAMAKGEPSNICPSGFSLDSKEPYCKDLDECAELNPCSHSCQNTPGSFMCSCPLGLSLAADGKVCRDIDECELMIAVCHKSQECVNTVGSWRCLPKCESGHRRNTVSQLCDDTNECAETVGLCEQECINAPGSYMCACKQGYRLIGRSRCQDINECQERINRCTHSCRNTLGGYQCACPQGYRLEGEFSCVDIDECAEGRFDCLFGQKCRNIDGGYECISACATGFIQLTNGSCVDVDECLGGEHKCQYNQLCINIEGSYSCSCPRGFRSDGLNRPCLDVDECRTQAQCQHECLNTLGSFHCMCPKGYMLTANGRTCQDIDECVENAINCGSDKRCFNRRGDFECVDVSCPAGYERDPQSGYCTINCSSGDVACRAKLKHKDVLEFHLIALPSGIRAHQDLIRLLVFDQSNIHLTRSTFTLINDDPPTDHDSVPFEIRTEYGKGIIYTLKPLEDRATYQMKVEGVAYDQKGQTIVYHTTFVVHISVSSYPY